MMFLLHINVTNRMIKRRSLQLISSNIGLIASHFSMLGQRDLSMLSVTRFSSDFCTSFSLDLNKGRCFTNGLGLNGGCSENIGNVLRNNELKSNCLGGNIVSGSGNRVSKVPSVFRVSEEVIGMNDKHNSVGLRGFNGGYVGGDSRGSFDGVVGKALPEKIMIAVDIDEVLGNFVSALNQFIADRYSINHSVSEYHVYEFFKIWNCSRDEADIRVHEFFKSPYFKKGIYPIPGAREALKKLAGSYNLSIVTSRQNVIKDHSVEWINNHYPGLFKEIHFGNHFALHGKSRPKSEICKDLGAKVLIDDNPRYAAECAEHGIRVLLSDYQNMYPWCKSSGSICQHPLVTKVHNWEEVENHLASSIVIS